jgi:hypothetical protein
MVFFFKKNGTGSTPVVNFPAGFFYCFAIASDSMNSFFFSGTAIVDPKCYCL